MKFKLLVFIGSALYLHAVGIGFEYASAEVSAHGNTGVVNLGSASAIHYNPGALSFLDEGQSEINVFSIFGESEWKTEDGRTFRPDDDAVFAGTAYISYPLEFKSQKAVIGAGLTSSYGQSVAWPSDNPARNFGFEGDLTLVQYQLSYSHQLTPNLGVGVTWNWVDSELESVGGVFLPNDIARFRGEGNANFFQFGALYKPTNDWVIGAAYRSAFDLDHDGTLQFTSNNPLIPDSTVDAESGFDLPPHVIVGASYSGLKNWTFYWQSQWTGWSTFDELVIRTDDGLPDQPLVVDWDDGWIHSLGASYRYNQHLTLHAGYVNVESITPNENQLLTISDFDQDFFSAGVTYSRDRWSVDLAAVYIISDEVNITESNFGISGEHDSSALFINMGAQWKY